MHQILETLDSLKPQPETTRLADSYLLGFDTETTGVSPYNDAIVSATLVLRNPALGSHDDCVAEWVINPHRPISYAASKVNGFTNEYLEEHGLEPQEALDDIATIIASAQEKRIPLLAYNASFDIKMLEEDLKKLNLPSILDRCHLEQYLLVDPLVIDRAVSKRKGKRKLSDTTFYYGVQPHGDFHDATADTIAAVDLIQPISTLYPQVGSITLAQLMNWEKDAHSKWAQSFNTWLSEKGKKPISTTWFE